MSLLEWSKEFETGIAVIDADHKKLVKMANTLNDAMKSGHGKDVMGKLLVDLANYTVSHFQNEEKLMKQYAYTDTVAHTHQHEDLKAQVIDIVEKHKTGAVTITLKVMNFLRDWLINHILKSDKVFAEFLKAKGAT